jgi:MoxR-like ATPase
MTAEEIKQLSVLIQTQNTFVEKLKTEVHKVIVGQNEMLDKLLIALLCNGHVLLEGVPGLAKTLTISSLAKAINGKFSRIQFTPDLLPADVVGTMIYNQTRNEFSVKQGPIFGNFVLADEVNRSPAKVQSALLEAMQERQVTLGETTYKLDDPFMVLATQNPIDQEGTYTLPEAQLDRFLFKLQISYPNFQQEMGIIKQQSTDTSKQTLSPVCSLHEIREAKRLVQSIYMDDTVAEYITHLVFATRTPQQYSLPQYKALIAYGASPRAGINMALAAKAVAYINGRGFITPDDVKYIAPDVLCHRIGLNYEAEAENITAQKIVADVLNAVKTP